jgi:opacity protein-like surface antigen
MSRLLPGDGGYRCPRGGPASGSSAAPGFGPRFARPLAALAVLVAAAPADAQGWSGTATLYGWLPVITGDQEGPDGEPVIDLDGKDVLEALDVAAFATGEVRRDRFGLMLDFAYTDLGSDAEAEPPFTAEASVATTVWFAAVAGTWRLQGTSDRFVDAYAGVRYYDASLDFDLSLLDDRVDRSLDADATWFDPLVGVKGRYPLSDRWSLYGLGDIGGFGIDGSSDLTWQAYSGLNFAFTDRFVGNFGYRYMAIDYDDEITLDVELHGPVLGLTYRF